MPVNILGRWKRMLILIVMTKSWKAIFLPFRVKARARATDKRFCNKVQHVKQEVTSAFSIFLDFPF